MGSVSALRISSLIRWLSPRPRALTSQPNSKYRRIFSSSRMPQQSITATDLPAYFTNCIGQVNKAKVTDATAKLWQGRSTAHNPSTLILEAWT